MQGLNWYLLAKAFGCRPSEVRNARAGDALFDLAVYRVGSEIEGTINRLAGQQDGKRQVDAYIGSLQRGALIEERAEERKIGGRGKIRRKDQRD